MTAKLKSISANGTRVTEPQTKKILIRRPSTAIRLPIETLNNSNESNSNEITVTTTTAIEDNEDTATIEKKQIDKGEEVEVEPLDLIPDVYKTQGTITYSSCTGYSETICLCSSIDELTTSAKRVTYLERRNWITTERLCELRKKAQDAIKNHKTFTIRGCFYSIRKGLVQRGWVEKLDIHRRAPVHGSCQVILDDVTQHLPLRRPGETRRQHIQKCERNIMSRFLEHMPIDFLWSARKEKTDWIDMARNPNITINKFHKSPFTTKEGLCNVLRDLHWFVEEGKSETYYPRSYNVWNADDLADFCDNYRMTSCISMLRFIAERTLKGECLSIETGQIPLTSIQFAIKQCKSYINCCFHHDIDEDFERIWDHDWEIFLIHFQMLTQEDAKFQSSDDPKHWIALIDESKKVLQEVIEHWPQCNLDGVLNIWIVKPSNRCRGRGIHLMNDIKKIVNYVNPPVVNKGRYVVQKYIERPMIIHNCKFDIRQWFLVTSVQPLIIWMYKESYLRFSSQEYDLDNFHESVHLTNHAIQKRYENGKRDERLPRENMWDCHTFQAYLRQIGKASMWSEQIYPGMQRALIGTMLASQDTMDRRMNTFELFGADFMISEDCQPWLIEINASPDLGASTSVTARLCPQCLEDVMKVVIDYRNDPKSSTGGFEMIYRQIIPPAPAYLGLNLFLKGTQVLPKNYGKKEKNKSNLIKMRNERRFSMHSNQTTKEQLNADVSGSSNSILVSPRPFVIDFIECINNNGSATDLPASAPKYGQLKSIGTLKKTSDAIKDNQSPRSKINAHKEKVKYNDVAINRKYAAKNVDSARRHASCGPRLTSVATDENQLADNELIKNNSNITFIENKDLKCIGSKCGPDNVSSATSSPRKPSNDTPRIEKEKSRLRPLNTFRSNAHKSTNNSNEKTKTQIDSRTPSHMREYRKYLAQSNLQLSKLPSKLPINDNYYNSHFFAVGLSLRAWRSKYNRILKTRNDNSLSLAQSCGMSSSRKTKKT